MRRREVPASAAKEREEFEKEKLRLQGELDGVKNRLSNALNYQEELEQRNTAAEEKIAHLEEVLEEAENNALRTNRLVEHLKSEKESMQSEVDERGVLMKNLEEKMNKMDKTLERKEKQNRDLATKLEAAQKDQEAANARAAQFRDNLDQNNKELEKTKRALADTSRLGSLNEGSKLRNELTKLTKQGAALTKRYQLLEQNKAKADSERDRLRQTLAVMEREVMLDKKQAEADRRTMENLAREKEIMSKNLQTIQAISYWVRELKIEPLLPHSCSISFWSSMERHLGNPVPDQFVRTSLLTVLFRCHNTLDFDPVVALGRNRGPGPTLGSDSALTQVSLKVPVCRYLTEATENLNMLNIQEQNRKKLEHELELNEAQLNKQRLLIRAMQKDKDSCRPDLAPDSDTSLIPFRSQFSSFDLDPDFSRVLNYDSDLVLDFNPDSTLHFVPSFGLDCDSDPTLDFDSYSTLDSIPIKLY
ncbi:Cilia- and flagella-associated protein 58 [Eumeta japonica]|uniref:Cilia-and flagella-associated protein 58 n=1 Tax=Eumeta variegata TaxID=151549 RepID=A0A4C1XEZ0_EUMVA|nr:Cilia- and flagella-associated protein 58 [Eumeta japonica]